MYGREALRRMREQQEATAQEPDSQPSLLQQIPPDAPMDEPDAVLHVWNGERWISWSNWQVAAPVATEEPVQVGVHAIPADAICAAGDCGATRVWLVKDGERWFMYAGSRKAAGRRRDFATPYLGHAIRTAEQWYGAAGGGWRAEKGCDGKADRVHEAADLPAETENEGVLADGSLALDGC